MKRLKLLNTLGFPAILWGLTCSSSVALARHQAKTPSSDDGDPYAHVRSKDDNHHVDQAFQSILSDTAAPDDATAQPSFDSNLRPSLEAAWKQEARPDLQQLDAGMEAASMPQAISHRQARDPGRGFVENRQLAKHRKPSLKHHQALTAATIGQGEAKGMNAQTLIPLREASSHVATQPAAQNQFDDSGNASSQTTSVAQAMSQPYNDTRPSMAESNEDTYATTRHASTQRQGGYAHHAASARMVASEGSRQHSKAMATTKSTFAPSVMDAKAMPAPEAQTFDEGDRQPRRTSRPALEASNETPVSLVSHSSADATASTRPYEAATAPSKGGVVQPASAATFARSQNDNAREPQTRDLKSLQRAGHVRSVTFRTSGKLGTSKGSTMLAARSFESSASDISEKSARSLTPQPADQHTSAWAWVFVLAGAVGVFAFARWKLNARSGKTLDV